jgi:hypothetical protein
MAYCKACNRSVNKDLPYVEQVITKKNPQAGRAGQPATIKVVETTCLSCAERKGLM